LKAECSVRPRVSTRIVLQNKIDSQMSSAVKATDGNAKEPRLVEESDPYES
jgi:hypothetical protein